MNRRSFVGLLSGALLHAQDPPQQANAPAPNTPPGSYVIAGVVVQSATNAPINKALVTIASTIDRTQNRQVVTGPDGRFSFTNLPAFKFSLTVTRSAGAPQAYLGRGAYSSAIVTGPNQDTSNIVFRFHMPASLACTVTDDHNDPVRGAFIHLFASTIDQNGMRRISQSQQGIARSSGQYRFAHLSPGNYLIAVSARPWFAEPRYGAGGLGVPGGGRIVYDRMPIRTDPQFDVAYPFTFYPGSSEAAGATPVVLSDGRETAVQIGLRAVPAIHVRLVGGASQQPGAGTSVQVSALGPEGHPVPLNTSAFVQNGQGELNGIAPGRYQLVISSFSAPAARGRVAGGLSEPEEFMAERPGFSRKIVDLVDGSVVDLAASSRISVRAMVKLNSSDRPQNRIALLLLDPRTGTGANGIAGTDDIIKFPEANLYPGRFELRLPNTPAFRIVSVEAKGAKVIGSEIAIEDNADVQLVVTIARRSSVNVEGFALRDKTPMVGAMVLLLPKNASPGATAYQDQSDSDGSFIFHNVSAGNYVAVAIDDGHDLAFGDPAVLKPYLTGALEVKVGETNAPPTLQVPVQQRIA